MRLRLCLKPGHWGPVSRADPRLHLEAGGSSERNRVHTGLWEGAHCRVDPQNPRTSASSLPRGSSVGLDAQSCTRKQRFVPKHCSLIRDPPPTCTKFTSGGSIFSRANGSSYNLSLEYMSTLRSLWKILKCKSKEKKINEKHPPGPLPGDNHRVVLAHSTFSHHKHRRKHQRPDPPR